MPHLLYKPVALAPTHVLFLLKLHKLQLAERLEHVLEIFLGDGEVDVADVEAMEGHAVRLGGAALGAGLAILLGFGGLDDDGLPEELLSGECNRLLNRFFRLELNVADTMASSAMLLINFRHFKHTPWTAC